MLSIVCAVEVFRALLKPHVDGPGAARWRLVSQLHTLKKKEKNPLYQTKSEEETVLLTKKPISDRPEQECSQR